MSISQLAVRPMIQGSEQSMQTHPNRGEKPQKKQRTNHQVQKRMNIKERLTCGWICNVWFVAKHKHKQEHNKTNDSNYPEGFRHSFLFK